MHARLGVTYFLLFWYSTSQALYSLKYACDTPSYFYPFHWYWWTMTSSYFRILHKCSVTALTLAPERQTKITEEGMCLMVTNQIPEMYLFISSFPPSLYGWTTHGAELHRENSKINTILRTKMSWNTCLSTLATQLFPFWLHNQVTVTWYVLSTIFSQPRV